MTWHHSPCSILGTIFSFPSISFLSFSIWVLFPVASVLGQVAQFWEVICIGLLQTENFIAMWKVTPGFICFFKLTPYSFHWIILNCSFWWGASLLLLFQLSCCFLIFAVNCWLSYICFVSRFLVFFSDCFLCRNLGWLKTMLLFFLVMFSLPDALIKIFCPATKYFPHIYF